MNDNLSLYSLFVVCCILELFFCQLKIYMIEDKVNEFKNIYIKLKILPNYHE